MTETKWPYNHRHSSELWDIAAEVLTELSRRDEVNYRVRATPESVEKKIGDIMKTLTSFVAPEKAKFMFQNTSQGPVMWVVSDEGNQKLFRFRGKTIRDKDKKFSHMKYYLEEV